MDFQDSFAFNLPEIAKRFTENSPNLASNILIKDRAIVEVFCRNCGKPKKLCSARAAAEDKLCNGCSVTAAKTIVDPKTTISVMYPKIADLFTNDSPNKADETYVGSVKTVHIHCEKCGFIRITQARKAVKTQVCRPCGNVKSLKGRTIGELAPKVVPYIEPDSPAQADNVPLWNRTQRLILRCASCGKRREMYPQDISNPKNPILFCQGCSTTHGAKNKRRKLKESFLGVYPEASKLFCIDSPLQPKNLSPKSAFLVKIECPKCFKKKIMTALKAAVAGKRKMCQDCYTQELKKLRLIQELIKKSEKRKEMAKNRNTKLNFLNI